MKVDAPYVIGVIRHEEKGLLEEDEYVRLIEAPTPEEAAHVLLDTPYGAWMNSNSGPREAMSALEERLVALQKNLEENVDNQKLLYYIQTRYDALNIAGAFLLYSSGAKDAGELSRLGSIAPTVLQSVIWHNVDWEHVPLHWEEFLRQEKDAVHKDGAKINKAKLLQRVHEKEMRVLNEMAVTDFSQMVASLTSDRMWVDQLLREQKIATARTPLQNALAENVKDPKGELDFQAFAKTLSEYGYKHFEAKDLEEVRMAKGGLNYDFAWDARLIEELRTYTSDPVSLDAILAFWLAVEMEVKTVRLLLSGKSQRLDTQKLRKIQRPLYISN